MNDFDIKLVGDTEILAALKDLDYKTQHSVLKRVLNDAATKTFVKSLRREAPKKTGVFSKSFGVVKGKNRKAAVVFAGARMGGGHAGYLANIIEFNKMKPRYPGFDKKTGQQRKRPSLPDGSIRMHSGIFPVRPFIKRTLETNVIPAQNQIINSMRTIIQRSWNSKVKKGLV